IRTARSGLISDRLEINIEFRRPSGGGVAPQALIRLAANAILPSTNGSDTTVALRASVECIHGMALLEGPQDVTWNLGTGDRAGQRFVESLASDRPDVEVMLDHFSRRVV